jgi:hypothetical protein
MCTAFTPQLTEFLAKNGEKSAVLVSSDFTQAPTGKANWKNPERFPMRIFIHEDVTCKNAAEAGQRVISRKRWT